MFKIKPISGTRAEIMLPDAITIEHVGNFQSVLMKCLKKYKHVLLDVNQLGTVDVACLQVFAALQKSVQQNHTYLEINGKLKPQISDLIQNTGFDSGILKTHNRTKKP